MEGLTAFVSKFDTTDMNDTSRMSPVLSSSRKPPSIASKSNSTVLPFSIEGILSRDDYKRDEAPTSNRFIAKQGKIRKRYIAYHK